MSCKRPCHSLQHCKFGLEKDMAVANDNNVNDSFGSFMQVLKKKMFGEINSNYFPVQKGVVLQEY